MIFDIMLVAFGMILGKIIIRLIEKYEHWLKDYIIIKDD